jgi:hypothetical protein
MKRASNSDEAPYWAPPPYRRADVRALQAIALFIQGNETPSPQDCKRALDWIVNVAAATYDEPFRPGQQDAVNYMLGRRSVGLAIVKMLTLKPETIPE